MSYRAALRRAAGRTGSRYGASSGHDSRIDPSTSRLNVAHVFDGSGPHVPRSCPTTCSPFASSGAPELPPAVAPLDASVATAPRDGVDEAATAVEAAVNDALDRGWRTGDLVDPANPDDRLVVVGTIGFATAGRRGLRPVNA